jgi:hypothetical protein
MRARCETLRASLRSSGEGNSDFVLEQARSLTFPGSRPTASVRRRKLTAFKQATIQQPSSVPIPRANLIPEITSTYHAHLPRVVMPAACRIRQHQSRQRPEAESLCDIKTLRSTRRAVLTHVLSHPDECRDSFPRLGFPPGPPFPRRPLQKGNPPGGKPIPATPPLRGGATARLFFVFCRRPAHQMHSGHHRIRWHPEHICCLGGQHHNAALPIPPTPQGIQAHRPHYVLSPVHLASCFGGRGRSATGSFLTRLPTLQGKPPAVTKP